MSGTPTIGNADTERTTNIADPGAVSDVDDDGAPAPAPAPAPAAPRLNFLDNVGDEPEHATEDDAPQNDDGEYDDDAHASLTETTEAPVDQQSLMNKTPIQPDVVAAQEEARRNAVSDDAVANGASSAGPQYVPAHVDPAIAKMKAVTKCVGPGWRWWQVDMSKAEHGVVHDDSKPISVKYKHCQNHGKNRITEQSALFALGKNGTTMMSQAIILPIHVKGAPSTSKPTKMLFVPIEVDEDSWPEKESRVSEIKDCVKLLPIQAEVVEQIFMRDQTTQALPSDLHPDKVSYVSFTERSPFEECAAAQDWTLFSSTTFKKPKEPKAPKADKASTPSADPPSTETDANNDADDEADQQPKRQKTGASGPLDKWAKPAANATEAAAPRDAPDDATETTDASPTSGDEERAAQGKALALGQTNFTTSGHRITGLKEKSTHIFWKHDVLYILPFDDEN